LLISQEFCLLLLLYFPLWIINLRSLFFNLFFLYRDGITFVCSAVFFFAAFINTSYEKSFFLAYHAAIMKRFVLLFMLLLWSASNVLYAEVSLFRSGVDMLDDSRCSVLQGKKVALITNAAALTSKGEPGYTMLLRNGVDLRFLMAPEHGFTVDVEAGKRVSGTVIQDSLNVYSLYGASKKPDARLLGTVDLVAFDLQDVGARCYTYISTMKLAMEACEEAGKSFMVLDRPNPISPVVPSGFMAEKKYESFVSAVDVPFVHGLTIGEIAQFLQKTRFRKLQLQVVRMAGYDRSLFGDELQGFTFRSPSPNIRNVETAIVYPATVMLEATTVSEGRGTDAPFLQFGAPYIRGSELARQLAGYALPGVTFHAVEFTPRSGKFKGERCSGVRIAVTDRTRFEPFTVSAAILLLLHHNYKEKLGLEKGADFFDRLAGTDRFRRMITSQASLRGIVDAAERDVNLFIRNNRDILMYPCP